MEINTDVVAMLILATVLGCIPGAIAQRKGYDFAAWWLFGAALFVVALPASLMVKPKQAEEARPRG